MNYVSTDSLVIGINHGSESGACLFKGTSLEAAVAEERFTRKKLDDSYPFKSIEWICREYSINKNDEIEIGYGFTNGAQINLSNIFERISEYKNFSDQKQEIDTIFERYSTEWEVDRGKFDIFKNITKQIFPKGNIHIFDHHVCHRSAAFFCSGFKEAYILTCDGRGDGKSLTFSKSLDGNQFEEIYFANNWESIGYFYGRITSLCGFTANRHEGKITGLAASGDPRPAMNFVQKMINVKNGKVYSNLGPYYKPYFSNYSDQLLSESKNYRREDLAAAAQHHLEFMVLSLIDFYTSKLDEFNLCLAGGVFANVKLNHKIKNIRNLKNLYIFPNMSDGGLSVGACFEVMRKKSKNLFESKFKRSMYLGPNISTDNLQNLAQNNYLNSKKLDTHALIDRCVEILTSGGLIALCQGRSEFGPRALGNRSLIALPTDRSITQKINKHLSRDDFMPFAPVMMLEKARSLIEDFNDNDLTSQFMVSTFSASEVLKNSSPAIVHIDGSCRIQTITSDDNYFLFCLLQKLNEKYKIDCLINTSFNMHEEPIVSDEVSIIDTFLKSGVEALVSPPFIFTR